MLANEEMKCVIVVDEELPTGILVNTAAILGITFGKLVPEFVGTDVTDGSGQVHKGIVNLPVPVLKGNKEILKSLREKLYSSDFEELTVVDFSDVAQNIHVYEEYIETAKNTQGSDFIYLGLLIYGSKKKVNKLTGSMPLLR